ncbi:MAG: hypothetical protein GKR89_05950 [Candidatus Latescibacteria bacterium]|nr:hypothetical protein [Candidatus Latescibacterota bacterium]
MAHAYTPGLRVTAQATIEKQRRLPLQGEVLVEAGEQVGRDQIVARTQLPGDVTTLNLVNRLGTTPAELPNYLLKKEGDPIAKGEPLAENKPFIKWFKTIVESPIDGTLESISSITGQLILRTPPRPVEVNAYVDGTVTQVLPGEGVSIETHGAFIQGIFGIGGEYGGELILVSEDPDTVVEAQAIGPECAGRIVVGGSLLTSQAIARAREVGAVGLIGGGIRDQDLRELLGYDLGVAITGTEDIGLAVIVTEGFGQIAMAARTFDILRACAGRQASVSGATQIRAGVQRPEIIVPDLENSPTTQAVQSHEGGLQEGDLLRVIRAPYFGRLGKVSDLPAPLQQVESGVHVRVLEVEFDDGSRALVPRSNVELIEE